MGCAKMNFLLKTFESYRITAGERMHLVRRGHFPCRDKDGGHTDRSAVSENPWPVHLTCIDWRYTGCANKLPTSRLSKVIVYIYNIQTDRIDRNKPCSFAGGQIYGIDGQLGYKTYYVTRSCTLQWRIL